MNQILVTEKLYVTPELKRKKVIYKVNFIISIVVIIILCSFYVHSEYARNREQELSQDILAGMIEDEEITNEDDDGVWKIIISSAEQSQQSKNSQNPVINSKKNNNQKKNATYVTASNGKRYPSIGRIQIPKINVDYAILSETSVEWLKISPCKFWGPDLNEVGNVSIAGHNYRNKRFFSKVPTLSVGEKIKITDLNNRTITYKIFDKYSVEPEDTSCIDPIDGKEDKRVITLITCTNHSKKRVIVQAEEV